MDITSIRTIALTTLLCLLLGCHRPGPVQVQPDDDGVTEVQAVSGSSEVGNEQDTVGLVAAEKSRYAGFLVAAEARFDTQEDTTTIETAGAVFLDQNKTVVIDGDTIGFESVDAGIVLIDGLPLYRLPRRLRFSGDPGARDTLVGVRYRLVSRDGVGGRGFSYSPEHLYEWSNLYPDGFTFDVRGLSAQRVRVTSPTAKDEVSRRHNLVVEWIGGEEVIDLIVSVPRPGGESRPLFRMKLRNAKRHIVIPAKIMQLLPANRLIFSFVSQKNLDTQFTGFQGAVLVHSASIHNIIVTVKQ